MPDLVPGTSAVADRPAGATPIGPMVWFVAFTFLLTWAAWLAWAAMAAMAAAPGASLAAPIRSAVFLAGVFMPGIMGLALTVRFDGRDAVRKLLGRIGRWRVPVVWYAFAVAYMAASKLGAAAIVRVSTGEWPAFGDTPWLLMLAAIAVSTWGQAGEEVGWRGYLLPRLATRMGLGWASLVLGVIWAAWHLPLFLMPGTGSDGQPFPVYLLHVTALSVAMAGVYWKTRGSLLLVMLMHASVNNTTGIVPAMVPGASEPFTLAATPVAWATVVIAWVVAAAFLLAMRGARLEEP